MEKVIDKLYRTIVEEEVLPVSEETLENTIAARERLVQSLSEEQRTLFDEYLEAECIQKDEELQASFRKAFIMGVRLGEETFRNKQ